MGLFKRVGDIISVNLNEMLERFEDPETMLHQAISEMEVALANAMEAAARVIANERLLAKQLEEHRGRVQHHQQRAEKAILAGNDDSARSALLRKAEQLKLTVALSDQHTAAKSAARKLRTQIDALRVRLSEARRKQSSLIARKRAAEARRKLTQTVEGVMIDSSAFSEFDRMSHTLEQAEAEADSLVELTWHELETDEIVPIDLEVESELEALKQTLAPAE